MIKEFNSGPVDKAIDVPNTYFYCMAIHPVDS